MVINDEMIERLADLAKLEFTSEEKEALEKDMGQIITYIEKLNELNTDNIEPLIFMSEEQNVLRKDEIQQTINRQEALLNAPAKDSDYFRVPKFLEK